MVPAQGTNNRFTVLGLRVAILSLSLKNLAEREPALASKSTKYDISLKSNLFPDPDFTNEKGYDSFFSLYHTTVSDRTFNDLLCTSARLLLLELIRLAYKERSTSYTVDARLLPQFRGVTTELLLSELSDFNYLEPLKRNNKNEIRENKNNSAPANEPETPVFDFQKVYDLYPVKKKGPNCEANFHDQIKTQADYDDLVKSIENYLAHLALPQNSWRRPKQTFAAYLGTKRTDFFWREWINHVEPAANTAQPLTDHYKNQAQRLGVRQ
jgi:hypothetical protein